MNSKIICSGLGSFSPCPKREDCANFKHWIDDPRSEFNACRDEKLPYFVPRDVTPEPVAGQLELFA